MLAASLNADYEASFIACSPDPQEVMIQAMKDDNRKEYFKMAKFHVVSAHDDRYTFLEHHRLVHFALPKDIIDAPERVSQKGCAWGDALWKNFHDPQIHEAVIINLATKDPWALWNFGERFVRGWETTLVQILSDEWLHKIFSRWSLPPTAEYECWRLGRSSVCKSLGYPLHKEWIELHRQNVAVTWKDELITPEERLCIAARHGWSHYVDQILQELVRHGKRLSARGFGRLLQSNVENSIIFDAISHAAVDETCLHQCIRSGRLLVLSVLATHSSFVNHRFSRHNEGSTMILWLTLFKCPSSCQTPMLESVASIMGTSKCLNELRKMHLAFEKQGHSQHATLCSQMFHHLNKEQ